MKQKSEMRKDGSIRIQTVFEKPTRCQQHMAEACDLNRIMARYMKQTGDRHLERLPEAQGVFADFTLLGDYQENLNRALAVRDAFQALPSIIRAELSNDPAQLEPWLSNPENTERAIKYGLMKPKTDVQKTNEPSNEKKPDVKLTDPKPVS